MRTALETEALRRLYMREACILRQRIQLIDLQRVALTEQLAAKQAQLDATRHDTTAPAEAPIVAE